MLLLPRLVPPLPLRLLLPAAPASSLLPLLPLQQPN